MTAGYPPFLPQMPPHVGLPPELCPRELLPLSAAAAAALGSISPGASLPYASRPSLVSSWQCRFLADCNYTMQLMLWVLCAPVCLSVSATLMFYEHLNGIMCDSIFLFSAIYYMVSFVHSVL